MFRLRPGFCWATEAEPGVPCKLAAILSAELVGYSRLMEADEAGTRAGLGCVLMKQ